MASTQLSIIRNTTKFLQATSPKAKEVEVSEEDSARNQEGCFVYSVQKIRGIEQGHAKSWYKSKRK
jgi:hypothetical protein